ECRELSMSAYEPCAEAAAFAERHGFRVARHFWLMEQRVDDLPSPDWPTGIETRLFDASPRALQDWNDVYNASFARHYHFVPSTVELCRAATAAPGFDADELLLAYDGADCVASAVTRCTPRAARSRPWASRRPGRAAVSGARCCAGVCSRSRGRARCPSR